MGQISFADAEYAGKRNKTRRDVFLEEMELVVPLKALLKLIVPHYHVAGRGRRSYPLGSILRLRLMQNGCWMVVAKICHDGSFYLFASFHWSVTVMAEAYADRASALILIPGRFVAHHFGKWTASSTTRTGVIPLRRNWSSARSALECHES